MIFQISAKLLQKSPSQHYSYESIAVQKTPWTCVNCCSRSLVAIWNRGAHGELDSGDDAHRRRGERGEGARGGRALPVGGFGRGWGQSERGSLLRGGGAAMVLRGGSASAALSGGERAGKLQCAVGKLASGSIGAEEDRGGVLHGEAWGNGDHGRGRRAGRAGGWRVPQRDAHAWAARGGEGRAASRPSRPAELGLATCAAGRADAARGGVGDAGVRRRRSHARRRGMAWSERQRHGSARGRDDHGGARAREKRGSERGGDDAVDDLNTGTCWPVRETSKTNIWTLKQYLISTNDQVKLPLNPN
jgi:hypothetical protein